MRLLQLTAGSGSFLCGTCLRDAALVRELRGQGHDAMLAPLYLPLLLEDGLDTTAVRMGGINVWMAHASRLRLPRFVQDWLDSPRLLAWAARRGEMTQASVLGEMTVSMLRGSDGGQHDEIEKLLGWLATLPRPDVILLSNALLLGLARPLADALGVPIACTLQGEAPFLDAIPEPHRSESWRLAAQHARDVAVFVAVSRYTGDLMRARLALPAERVHVVHNGIDPRPYSPGASFDGPPTIAFVARLHRDKGIETLIEAFLALKRRPEHAALRLVAAGATLKGDWENVARWRARLADAGHAASVELRSNVPFAEKLDLLRRASVFSVPATYGESFGLYLLEAWAMGLPVVQPDHAAFPELVEAARAGVLCAPDDPAALADALHGLLTDRARARQLGANGRAAVEERFGLARMAREVERVCRMAAPRAEPSLAL